MSSNEYILSQLRDLREPPVPVAEPLSLLAILTATLLVIFTMLLVANWIQNRHSSWLKHYLSELRQIKYRLSTNNCDEEPGEMLSQLAQLIRRYVTHVQPPDERGNIALMQGSTWLNFLDQTFATQYFTQGNGQVFGTALYNGDAKQILYLNSKEQQGLAGICNRLEALLRNHAQRSTLNSRRRHNRQPQLESTSTRNR